MASIATPPALPGRYSKTSGCPRGGPRAGWGGPAGRMADEEPDRLVGIALRERRRDRADAQADDARCPEHPSSPFANRASNRTSSRYYKRLSKRSTRTEWTVSWERDFAPSPPIIDRHGAAAATSGSGI